MPHHCSIDDDLRGRGYKKTHPRHRIIELFEQPRLWSARDLQAALHDVGIATIYRTLRMLEKEQVITSVPADGEDARYERIKAHHDHRSCDRCHTVECLPCPIPNLNQHTLYLKGLCSSCIV